MVFQYRIYVLESWFYVVILDFHTDWWMLNERGNSLNILSERDQYYASSLVYEIHRILYTFTIHLLFYKPGSEIWPIKLNCLSNCSCFGGNYYLFKPYIKGFRNQAHVLANLIDMNFGLKVLVPMNLCATYVPFTLCLVLFYFECTFKDYF